jgi:autotransporter family porin
MGGYGDTSTTAKGTEYNATGSLHGFSVGPYATWYRESDDKSGSYVDVWALWNRFDGTTNGEGIDSESYRLQGMVLSAEVGYDQLLSKRASKNESNRFLKWQGQVTYQGVDGGNKVESNGTVVDLSHRNVQTRLGVRYYSKPNGLKTSYNQPYVELNWYHNTNPTETQLDETKVSLQGTSNIGGIKVGSEYKINESMELWGYGFYAKGGDGYNSYGIRLGIKDMF